MSLEYYAVCFDNDEDFPGMLQWLNIGDFDNPGNLTDSYSVAKEHMEDMLKLFPDINYRVVALKVQDDNGYADEGYDDGTHQ